jgi:LPXTG-site transpeptidase (sortase) family protein
MSGRMDGGGFLSRLRDNETLRKISGGRPDLVIFGAPVAVLAVIAVVVIALVAMGGDSGNAEEEVRATATSGASATPATTRTPQNAGLKTPIAFSEGAELTLADLALRGSGEPARGEFTGDRLIIPKIGVDAPFSFKVVGPDGQMPNPNGASDVAYYDFSQWPGLGGLPNAGGNVVMAGHVDYINVGPAVFWELDSLVPGDVIQVRMQDGTVVEYAVEFNKWVQPGDADWSSIVAGTGDESITLITCTGEFSAGHYDKRQVVWGRRVA